MVNTKLHYEPVGDFFQQDDEVDEKDKHESKGVKTGQKAFGLKVGLFYPRRSTKGS